ncbi:hypothetical protein [Actinacidiphila sp. bgisy160]|uniref:hypothetical protein n=1 Tax=Actinacidiphila sp. bgisy160 TaxID=3413796 RepID=UPI003D742861
MSVLVAPVCLVPPTAATLVALADAEEAIVKALPVRVTNSIWRSEESRVITWEWRGSTGHVLIAPNEHGRIVARVVIYDLPTDYALRAAAAYGQATGDRPLVVMRNGDDTLIRKGRPVVLHEAFGKAYPWTLTSGFVTPREAVVLLLAYGAAPLPMNGPMAPAYLLRILLRSAGLRADVRTTDRGVRYVVARTKSGHGFTVEAAGPARRPHVGWVASYRGEEISTDCKTLLADSLLIVNWALLNVK